MLPAGRRTGEVGGATFFHGTAMLQHIDAVGDPKGRGRVLLHDQDCGAAFPDLFDAVKDQAFQPRRDADGGLVERHEFDLRCKSVRWRA